MNNVPNLQLMIYDETDVTKRLRELQRIEVLPPNWELPDITLPVGLTHSWLVGGRVYRALRRIDDCAGFRVWYRALEWLATFCPEQRISEIQYWGHGSPGKVWMDGEVMTCDVFDGPLAPLLKAVRDRLTPDALIWFRTCASFGAQPGQIFARRWAEFMNCRVAGYTYNIGLSQSGLHSLRPGQHPWWPLDEGIKDGTPIAPQKMAMSRFWAPNTIHCLRSTIPNTW